MTASGSSRRSGDLEIPSDPVFIFAVLFAWFGLVALIQFVFPGVTYHEVAGSLLLLLLAGLALFYEGGAVSNTGSSQWPIIAIAGLFVFWATVPFWGRKTRRSPNKRRMTMTQKVLYIALWILMVILVASMAMRGSMAIS